MVQKIVLVRNLNNLTTDTLRYSDTEKVKILEKLEGVGLHVVFNTLADKGRNQGQYQPTIEDQKGWIIKTGETSNTTAIFPWLENFLIPNPENIPYFWPLGHPHFKVEDWRADESNFDGYYEWLWKQLQRQPRPAKEKG